MEIFTLNLSILTTEDNAGSIFDSCRYKIFDSAYFNPLKHGNPLFIQVTTEPSSRPPFALLKYWLTFPRERLFLSTTSTSPTPFQ